MIRISGQYFDGNSSTPVSADLAVYRDGQVVLTAADLNRKVRFSDLRISDRVGDIPRNIYFDDDAKFETQDNNAIDQILRERGSGLSARVQHALESRWRFIGLALVVVLVSSFGFVRYGIPTMAKAAAYSLPAETTAQIGKGTLEIMDKSLFQPSELDKSRQDALRKRFGTMIPGDDKAITYSLEFRRSDSIGANAFALPSGTIVMTDEMVRLAKHDDELISVLAHEIGHVRYRHSLRSVIQNSMVAMLVVLITGDVSSTTALVTALPTLFVEAQYSQLFEIEADRYSLDYLLANRIPPRRFTDIMQRMEQQHMEKRKDKRPEDDEESFFDYFSSHPPTKARIKVFQEAQRKLETR